MIKSKQDYKRFLLAEQNSKSTNFFVLYWKNLFAPTLQFLLLLRTCEYLKNRRGMYKLLYPIVKYLKYRKGLSLGFSIPENVADEGLQLPHYGTIVIHPRARLGKFCRVHVCVNIGASAGGSEAPQLGDYVYVAPGVKIYGDIKIANKVVIAANAAVSASFVNEGVMIGGIPAKELKQIDITNIIKKGN
ncbi:MAG TPA: serine acetyltransferase [Chryseosolibacter sp.]